MSRCLTGKLLVASPHLSDRNFFRSVVLIVSHDHEHAFGFLLNRRGYESLADAWLKATDESIESTERLRCGGPLDGPIMLLHQNAELGESQIVPGAYISTTEGAVAKTLHAKVAPLLPIKGYSGWGPGQLETELEIGGWMIWPATKELLFAEPDEMWNLVSAQVTESILPSVGSGHLPSDPSMN